MRGRDLRSLAALVALGCLTACSGILGLKDLQPYPDDGGLGDANGDSTQGDGPSGDDGPATGDSSMHDGGHDGPQTSDGPGGDSTSHLDSGGADAMGDTTTPPMDSSMDTTMPPVDSGQDTSTPPMDACTPSQSDPRNCGACGHDCLNGGCSGGVCQPFSISTGVDAYDLVATGGSLYWVDEATSVWTCRISNCAGTATSVANGQGTPERIATDGTYVYWTNYGTGTTTSGSVLKMAISGGALSTITTGLVAPQGIAVDSPNVFWAETGSNKVSRFNGSSIASLTESSGALPVGVAARNGTVFWTDQGNGNVEKSPEGAWAATNVAQSQTSPWAMSVDTKYAYWVDFANPGGVWQYDLSLTSKHELSNTAVDPIRIVSDASQVYWAEQGTSLSSSNGSIVSCDPASCTPKALASSLSAPSSVAIDATGVYFGTVGDHQIWMAVR